MVEQPYVLWFKEITRDDVGSVGGKNASLGELAAYLGGAGIRVPNGFATTAYAYWRYLDANELRDRIAAEISRLRSDATLHEVGTAIRSLFAAAEMPQDLATAITDAYHLLSSESHAEQVDVAVRSSATAEDLPEASFAGQQESFLNVSGPDAVLAAVKRCFASLFTDRAISYREDLGFDHLKIALSAGVQRMVRSDLAGAGVMFSIDTETGFPGTVVINAARGLGETVVSGQVEPDEYEVFKPLLPDDRFTPIIAKSRGRKTRKAIYDDAGGTRIVDTTDNERASCVLADDEILTLARWATAVEEHYGAAMDMEWAKDGHTGELFMVQARPETVQSRKTPGQLHTYRLTGTGERLVSGLAIGDSIAAGRVCLLDSPDEIDRFTDGAILVTRITDPDWEPVMKRAAAIVTDHGGRTSHAAIVSRELGVTAIVGTGTATATLNHGEAVTVSCAEGDIGYVYAGTLDYDEDELDLTDLPRTRTEVLLNLANPAAALRWWRLPADGVGLARLELIVNNHVKVHPMALLRIEELAPVARDQVEELTQGYDEPAEYFVEQLAFGIAKIAAARWPTPVIVRTSDFKTNEYARLIGGARFEPAEENPMLGWRGASRYYSEGYRDGFALECRALRRVREEMGLTNVVVMIPFCRTTEEADRVLDVMRSEGLERGKDGLEIFVMAEIPSNILLAEQFAERFDGFSIGSNDLTQLILGVDRDSAALAGLFDETNPAVTLSIRHLITTAHAVGRKVGLCGQRPSDDPEFARFLVRAGIDSISVTPDSFLAVKQNVAAAEDEIAAEDSLEWED
ncbi:MAG TPA: phosphoenolpyruvate synthase [Jiangellaceae bacterium]|nr:phosphoenolpyruvate synthase [Jiangellaceae bacterium]